MEILNNKKIEENNSLKLEIKNFMNNNIMEDIPNIDDEFEVIYYSNIGELLYDYFTNIAFQKTPIREMINEMNNVNYDIDELVKVCFNDYMFKTKDDEFVEIIVSDE